MPYSAADVRSRPRLVRFLLCGPAKAGKTRAAVMTSPKPVYVMNTDGKGALDPVASQGGEFRADDIKTTADFTRYLAWLKAHIKEVNTLVFDNLTMYWQIVEKEVRKEVRDDPRVIFPEAGRRFMDAFTEMVNLPINVILIGHLEPGENNTPGGFGAVLGIGGKSKLLVSGLMQDWVWVECTPSGPGGKMIWEFLLAPQGNWNKGVRSIQGVKRMPADVQMFIDLADKQAKKPVVKKPEPPGRIVMVDDPEDGVAMTGTEEEEVESETPPPAALPKTTTKDVYRPNKRAPK